MKKITIFNLCLSLFFVGSLYSQQTVWVIAGGTGDGSSQDNAFGNMTDALAAITGAGDVLRVVGTITPGSQTLSKTFAYTIEGDAGGSTLTGVTGVGRMFTINAASSGQNVTFKNITFSGQNSSIAGGGGVLFSNQTGVTINFDNCRFIGNSLAQSVTTGGGALNITNSTVTITDCLFKENQALQMGGAIAIRNTSNVTMTRCTFYKNSTTGTTQNVGGGVLYVTGNTATVAVDQCTFFENNIGHPNQDYGTIRSDDGNTTITNSLFYDNKVKNGDGSLGGPSDWGSSPNGTQTFSKSIGQWITDNIDIRTNFISFVKNNTLPNGVAANLASSNLTYDDVSGKVKYNAPTVEGENSPIGFVAAGIDAGAWQSGLTLSLNREDLLESKISIYHNKSLNSLELYHTISEPLSIEIYNILGAKILNLKDVSKSQSIRASSLKNGIYILVGKTQDKFFSKKFLVN